MKANLLLSVLFVNLLLFSCKNDTSLPQVTQIPFKTSNSDNYGMMTPDGTILFEDEFKNMPSIAVNNIFSVKDAEGKLSYFTAEEKTQLISNEKYIDGGYYSEGIIPVVKSESSISFIDKKGREIFTLGTFEGKKIQAVNAYFSDGLMLFKIEGNKYGYINSKGQVAIKPVYDLAFPFNEKVAIVGKEKKNTETMDYYIIDCSGREIVRLKDIDFIKFDWNSMFFSDIYTNGNKAFNKKGERIFRSPSKWKVLLPYNENYTMFTTENNYGIVNKEGEIVIRNKYDVGIMNMKDHFIGINSSDSKYDLFFLDSNENRTTKIESIDDCSILSQDRIIIKEQDEYYFVDIEGNSMDKNNFSYVYIPSLSYSCIYPQSLFLAYISKEQNSTIQWVKSDYFPSQEAISSVLNALNSKGIDNLCIGMSLKEVMKYYNMGESDNHYYNYWNIFEGKSGVADIRTAYRVEFDDYIADFSGYNYNAKIKHIVINIELSDENYTNISRRIHDATVKYLESKGFTKTNENVSWMDETWDVYYNNQLPYIVALNTDVLKLCIERRN